MGWVRLSDDFSEHPKMALVGPLGWGIWAASLAYCNRNLTDGFVPRAVARSLGCFEVVDDQGRVWGLARTSGMVGDDIDSEWAIGLLLGAGIWEEVPGGYLIHDYLEYQPSRERVLADRDKERLRWGRRSGNPSAAPPARSAGGDAVDSAPTPPASQPQPQPRVSNDTRGARAEFADDFEAAWRLYPRKAEKQAAYRAYVATRRRKVAAQELLDATAAFAAAMRSEGRPMDKIKHGSTFYGPDEPWRDFLGQAQEAVARVEGARIPPPPEHPCAKCEGSGLLVDNEGAAAKCSGCGGSGRTA